MVFVALKAYSLPAIAPRLGRLLAPGAAAIWAQNGIPWWYFQSLPQPVGAAGLTGLESVDPGGVIAASISPEHNIGCVVYCSTEIVEPGVIRHIEGTRFTIGEPDGSDSASGAGRSPRRSPPAACKRAGRPQAARPDLAQARRQRRVQPDHGADRGDARRARHAPGHDRSAARACSPSAPRSRRSSGVTFPVSLDRRLEAGIAVGDHKTSMLQDLEAGKRLELDCMTGAIVELAARLGVDVPHTSTVHACVQLLDRLRAERADHG